MRTDLDYRSIPEMAVSSGDRFADVIAIIDGADHLSFASLVGAMFLTARGLG